MKNPDDVPLDAMMFDMQTMRFSSPAIDLITLLANSCSYQVREQNLEKILHVYHDTIIKVLKEKLGSDYVVPGKYWYVAFIFRLNLKLIEKKFNLSKV